MTSVSAYDLHESSGIKAFRLFIGLVSAMAFTATLFWSLQKLTHVDEQELLSGPARVSLDRSRPPFGSDAVFEEGSTVSAETTAIDRLEPVVDIQVLTKFRLGMKERSNLPIIKIEPHHGLYRKRAKEYRRMDGFCTVQNPVVRTRAARDSNIIKGWCKSESSG